jgi:hypothetical protein
MIVSQLGSQLHRARPGGVTLGGLLKHLVLVDDDVFCVKLHSHGRLPLWDGVD